MIKLITYKSPLSNSFQEDQRNEEAANEIVLEEMVLASIKDTGDVPITINHQIAPILDNGTTVALKHFIWVITGEDYHIYD